MVVIVVGFLGVCYCVIVVGIFLFEFVIVVIEVVFISELFYIVMFYNVGVVIFCEDDVLIIKGVGVVVSGFNECVILIGGVRLVIVGEVWFLVFEVNGVVVFVLFGYFFNVYVVG